MGKKNQSYTEDSAVCLNHGNLVSCPYQVRLTTKNRLYYHSATALGIGAQGCKNLEFEGFNGCMIYRTLRIYAHVPPVPSSGKIKPFSSINIRNR